MGTETTSVNEKTPFCSELDSRVDKKVEEFFDKIKKSLEPYANAGYTSVTIFFPSTDKSSTTANYDTVIKNYSHGLSDETFNKKIYNKFKSEGIKISIVRAVEHVTKKYYGLDEITMYHYGGYILVVKWDKDYRQECCDSCIIL